MTSSCLIRKHLLLAVGIAAQQALLPAITGIAACFHFLALSFSITLELLRFVCLATLAAHEN